MNNFKHYELNLKVIFNSLMLSSEITVEQRVHSARSFGTLAFARSPSRLLVIGGPRKRDGDGIPS